jgi:outer membrane protein assembly factor BamE (lipoprotein component of BamABCDE complex)
VVLLLATIVVAQAASTPSLTDIFHSKRFPYISTASASVSAHEDSYNQEDSYTHEGYGIETKQLCLQETEQKTCSWVSNCQVDAGAPAQPACVYGQ